MNCGGLLLISYILIYMLFKINEQLEVDFHPASFLHGGTFADSDGKDIMEIEQVNYVYDNIIKHPNPVFVDVGANIGVYSLLNKEKGFKIYSFEPHPIANLITNENVKRNKTNTVVFPYGLGEKDLTTYLNIPEELSHAGLTHISPNDEETLIKVEVKRMDQVITEKPTHIKIDVEGFELMVLQGMGNLLDHQPELFLEVDSGHMSKYNITIEQLNNFLREKGYKYETQYSNHDYYYTKD